MYHGNVFIILSVHTIALGSWQQIHSTRKSKFMKKVLSVTALALSFLAGAALSAQVRDWHDLDDVHKHVLESIREMDRARAANHYDMDGHGAKAEEHLHAAEHELDLAIQAARR
jgi:hypothetical protein